jgi:hypothetical protein
MYILTENSKNTIYENILIILVRLLINLKAAVKNLRAAGK